GRLARERDPAGLPAVVLGALAGRARRGQRRGRDRLRGAHHAPTPDRVHGHGRSRLRHARVPSLLLRGGRTGAQPELPGHRPPGGRGRAGRLSGDDRGGPADRGGARRPEDHRRGQATPAAPRVPRASPQPELEDQLGARTGGVMNDRHAFVTGAAGGIGRAIAARLLDDGFTGIVLADLRAEPLEATARALDRPGARILTVTVDVADRTAARRALTDGRDRLGSLDVLVNAAGLYPSRLLAEMGDEEWDRVLDVNLNGPFVLSTAFARQLIADKRPGHIVNI